MSASEDFTLFVESICKRPGMYFGHPENSFDRLQAFVEGLRWGQGLELDGKGAWITSFTKFEEWLARETPSNRTLWYERVLKEAGGDHGKALEIYATLLGDFIAESQADEK